MIDVFMLSRERLRSVYSVQASQTLGFRLQAASGRYCPWNVLVG